MANAITCSRILCALALMFCTVFSKPFYILYIFGGISDVLDGIVARYTGRETRLGAQLDTVADIIFTAIVLVKVLQTVSVPVWIIIWIVIIALIKCVSIVRGLIVYKRFISEHTIMNKICGIILFVIPICIDLFSWKLIEILMIAACAISTFAAFQEKYYICIGKEVS